MRLYSWGFENYRSIRSANFTPGDFTILIGKNNSGKSNILESLKEYAGLIDNTHTNLNTWFSNHVRGGNQEKVIKFRFEFRLTKEEKEEIDDWIIENYGEEVTAHQGARGFQTLCHTLEIGSNGLVLERLQTNLSGRWLTLVEQKDDQRLSLKYSYLADEGYKLPDSGGKLQPNSGENRAYKQHDISNDVRAAKVAPYRDIFRSFWESIEYISAIRRPKNSEKIRVQKYLNSDATNLASVLHTLSQNKKELFEKIVEKYVNIMENVTDVRTPIEGSGNNPITTIEIDEKGAQDGFRLEEISSGSKEILALITKIVLSKTGTGILLVEEPELHLHPGAEREVYDLLSDVAGDGPQVLITTHSDVFVNHSDADNILRIERYRSTTVVRRITESEIETELSDLGYEKSGLLQSEAVVFVEGKSDERMLKQFAKTCKLDLDNIGIELVELDGEGNIRSDGRSLVKLLSAFDIPYLFVVDSHGNRPKDVQDDILQHINSREGEWHITPDHIHVWNGYGIEDFLIELPDAIQSVVGGEPDDIRKMVQNYDGVDKAQALDNIFEAELGEPYDKNQHGMLIAKQADEEAIPDEVKEVIEKIRNLPE